MDRPTRIMPKTFDDLREQIEKHGLDILEVTGNPFEVRQMLLDALAPQHFFEYTCEPKPSGKDIFVLHTIAPVHKDDHIFNGFHRYIVLQVQHHQGHNRLILQELIPS